MADPKPSAKTERGQALSVLLKWKPLLKFIHIRMPVCRKGAEFGYPNGLMFFQRTIYIFLLTFSPFASQCFFIFAILCYFDRTRFHSRNQVEVCASPTFQTARFIFQYACFS
eukprot:c16972_g1_i2 orf=1-333(-)